MDETVRPIFTSAPICIPFLFFIIKIAEFAIILELNGYSDCLKIR